MEPPLHYPPLARQTQIQGNVVAHLKIAPDGSVLSVDFPKSENHSINHPLFIGPTEQLLKKWTFGCTNCPAGLPYEHTITFEYRLEGISISYDYSRVVTALPDRITLVTNPVLCDHCIGEDPAWCKPLPRPEYKSLKRIPVSDPWFEVYVAAPNVYAIYEPHQSEETISYLILGKNKALLLDTGMGMSDLKKVTAKLTKLPITVINSHTHDDHVGSNWQFDNILGMDTDFTRANARGSREDAQAEIAPGEICGTLPANFDPQSYATKPWKISRFMHDGDKIDLGGRTLEIIATPGHTPDAISLLDRANGLLFTGDTYYPAPIWLYRPETDFDAYAASIQRLAALAPQIKQVLGQHNVPVAPPSVLPTLVKAFAEVRAGKGACKPVNDTQKLCTAYGISFLLLANPPVVHSR
jgi:glyoxylase-like metal-dependent hydrolase (beta-lactamase superfamily II)